VHYDNAVSGGTVIACLDKLGTCCDSGYSRGGGGVDAPGGPAPSSASVPLEANVLRILIPAMRCAGLLEDRFDALASQLHESVLKPVAAGLVRLRSTLLLRPPSLPVPSKRSLHRWVLPPCAHVSSDQL
jgi:hypothetical protein